MSSKRKIIKDIMDQEIYCITAEMYSNGRSNIEMVTEMVKAGAKIIQYREKEKKLKDKYEECKLIRAITHEAGVTFIVNDDLDIAILVGADGVHIGQDDLPIEQVRRLVGDEMIIGLSTHSALQAQDAVERGADYIGVGPIFKTATKKDVCDPVGYKYLDYVVQNIEIPFVAIGGIKEQQIAEVVKHGAKCIALVTDITGAENVKDKMRRLKKLAFGYETVANAEVL
ncbi:MAG: thiamine phosphate synthase [Firmicutes bacterium HGW-Firmicutes-1]|jgi:thiamine-phosphate pyrophosphorylase|nr:MAG: thiamine phosphate synthase [Firmicutes bacterium HGW-Firmicutes-1]